jgi:hypothetical protein
VDQPWQHKESVMSQLTKVAITALVLGPTGAAWAAEAPAVDLSGLIYAHYGYALEEQADGANAFDLDRVYLTARSRLGKGFSTRVTTDVGRTGSADDTKLRPFLKYAYLQSKLNQSYSLRFGASGTAWCGQYDAFWGHRFIAASLADKNKLLSTSDLGVQALGKHMGGLLSWQAGVINGEGYGAPEVTSTKAAQARLTVDPLSSAPTLRLPISAFISQDILVASGEQGRRHLLQPWACSPISFCCGPSYSPSAAAMVPPQAPRPRPSLQWPSSPSWSCAMTTSTRTDRRRMTPQRPSSVR